MQKYIFSMELLALMQKGVYPCVVVFAQQRQLQQGSDPFPFEVLNCQVAKTKIELIDCIFFLFGHFDS